MSDQELIARAKAGDQDAFEQLVKEQCDGCRVDETDIIFRGLCADCRGINL